MLITNWNFDTANNIKVIKVFIFQEPGKILITDYLCSISDISFKTHASEMRFGETTYLRGEGNNLRAVIVPTLTISSIPRKYRRQNWFYLNIYCHPEDTRFDEFPEFVCESANKYSI